MLHLVLLGGEAPQKGAVCPLKLHNWYIGTMSAEGCWNCWVGDWPRSPKFELGSTGAMEEKPGLEDKNREPWVNRHLPLFLFPLYGWNCLVGTWDCPWCGEKLPCVYVSPVLATIANRNGELTEVSIITSSVSNYERKSLNEITLSLPLITHLKVLYSAGNWFKKKNNLKNTKNILIVRCNSV